MKLHHYLTFQYLGISKLPQGSHVHHRDCDILNNAPENLQLILASDHKWLHKQYGSAALRAIECGKIEIQEAAGWSDDPRRAEVLLRTNILTQSAVMSHLLLKSLPVDLHALLAMKSIQASFTVVKNFRKAK